MSDFQLPAVGGRRIACSNAEFERRARILLAEVQMSIEADSAMVAFLCDAVRLAREYSDAMQVSELAGAQAIECANDGADKTPCVVCESKERVAAALQGEKAQAKKEGGDL